MTGEAAFSAYYTNETSEELLREMNTPHHTDEQILAMDSLAAEVVRENQDYERRHPIIGIRRIATQGSRSKLGGEIRKGTLDIRIGLPTGKTVNVAVIGDQVEYPDGSSARITTGADENFYYAALVGSRVENGDEIIDTPQDGVVLTIRQGENLDNFLPEVGGQ
ncbi:MULTISPECIES: hypothetical protein [Pseudomonas]|uniref:hypothetical protein n=1 Tax=Pseudomonas TaxID=286 RepID=UPI001E2CADA9|nr:MULTISPECIES: hypothetical protein [Pseudomonas]MCE4072521.1 hypothetical protein [Pseudomonas nitritireducens]MCE4081614.1 hypothetical protein [Pseudomonas nitroreducens]